MAKRKITVTVDEELVEAVRGLGDEPLSAVVNDALAEEVDRRARARALGRLVEGWRHDFGEPAAEDVAFAATAFDELDAVDVPRSGLDRAG